MAVEIKFCGLTRAEDASQVGALGGSYAGVIFAGGPRRLDAERASDVLAAVGAGVQRVGVFAGPAEATARIVGRVPLDVVQLHGEPTVHDVERVRAETGARVWVVIRVTEAALAARVRELDAVADAILLDAYVPGRLGGTGTAFDWALVTERTRPRRSRFVAAGGLTPANVADAVRALSPDVVDVSSGVERSPGIKDHDRMREFADAVRRYRQDA